VELELPVGRLRGESGPTSRGAGERGRDLVLNLGPFTSVANETAGDGFLSFGIGYSAISTSDGLSVGPGRDNADGCLV
jgi:hypothetical protein